MGWKKKKVKNHAPQSAEEAEQINAGNDIGQLIDEVAGQVDENAAESLEAASGSDPVETVNEDIPKYERVERAKGSGNKEYSNHPKFNKFKNNKGSK